MVKFNENVIVALFDNSLDMNESIFSKYTENTKSTEYNPLEKVKRDIYGYEFEEGVPPPVFKYLRPQCVSIIEESKPIVLGCVISGPGGACMISID
tara:strand:+ start:1101 stop:1388 length:288 start_codon:yes stop_codon:yes gene_type:complete